MLNTCTVIFRGKMWLFDKSSHSYIELVHILISLNLRHLNNMFEALRQTFTLCDETFEKKSILSANKFVTLRTVYVLYVRVNIRLAIWHIL